MNNLEENQFFNPKKSARMIFRRFQNNFLFAKNTNASKIKTGDTVLFICCNFRDSPCFVQLDNTSRIGSRPFSIRFSIVEEKS